MIARNHIHLAKIGIIASLFAFTIWLFFPGGYSVDSWDQYRQMTTGKYDDWFDGGMALTWHFLWKVTGRFESLYVMDMLLYWLFFAVLLWKVSVRSFAFWGIAGLGVFFCFIPQYVMRDTLMSLLLLYAAFCLSYAGRHGRRAPVYVALGLLGYGLLVRSNVIIGLLPMIWISVRLLAGRPLAIWKHVLLSAGICAGLFIGTRLVIYNGMHAYKAYPAYKLRLNDITGVSKLSGSDCMPSSIQAYRYYSRDTLMANFTPADFDDIYGPGPGRQSVIPRPNAYLDSCVTSCWVASIRRHPFLYLENRCIGYYYYLRIRKRLKDEEYYNTAIWIEPGNPLHLQLIPHKARTQLVRVYNFLGKTFFYAPWLWLLLNVAGFIYFLRRSRNTAIAPATMALKTQAAIQLSGVLYILSQFPVYQTDRDFRLSYLNVFIALIWIATAWSAGKRREGPASE